MDFQQSQTFVNLQTAYKYELESISKNLMFSLQAEDENQLRIRNIFGTVSTNNRFIANRMRRLLYGGTTPTLDNLIESSENEKTEQSNFLNYSKVATQEGFTDIASFLNGVSNIKLNHVFTLQVTATDLRNNELYCKKEERVWICLGCGNIMSGLCAPTVCPVCGYPQSFYELFVTL